MTVPNSNNYFSDNRLPHTIPTNPFITLDSGEQTLSLFRPYSDHQDIFNAHHDQNPDVASLKYSEVG